MSWPSMRNKGCEPGTKCTSEALCDTASLSRSVACTIVSLTGKYGVLKGKMKNSHPCYATLSLKGEGQDWAFSLQGEGAQSRMRGSLIYLKKVSASLSHSGETVLSLAVASCRETPTTSLPRSATIWPNFPLATSS